VLQTLERGKKAADPMLVVMTHNSPVLKLEDSPNAELAFKASIPRDVPRVAVEIKVADVEQSAGPKYALALGQQSHLIVVIRNAGEDREEDDGVSAAGLAVDARPMPPVLKASRFRIGDSSVQTCRGARARTSKNTRRARLGERRCLLQSATIRAWIDSRLSRMGNFRSEEYPLCDENPLVLR